MQISSESKKSIYNDYIRTQLSGIRDISQKSLDRQMIYYDGYFKRFLPQDKKAEILDLGSGYGSLLYYLQKKGFIHAQGVEISAEQVELASKYGIKNLTVGSIIDFLENSHQSFTLIFMIDALEHFNKEDILKILELIRLRLQPGGLLVLQVPNADGPFGGRYRYYDFTHEIAFTSKSISQVLKLSQFSEVKVHPMEPIVWGGISLARFILWKLIRTVLVFYLAVETGSFNGYILTQNLIAVAKK